MPWDSSLANAGFSSAKPWLPVVPEHIERSVDVMEADSSSLLHRFRSVVNWKNQQQWLKMADLELVEDTGELLAFYRDIDGHRYIIILNLGATQQSYPLFTAGAENLTPDNYAHEISPSAVVLPPSGAVVLKLA